MDGCWAGVGVGAAPGLDLGFTCECRRSSTFGGEGAYSCKVGIVVVQADVGGILRHELGDDVEVRGVGEEFGEDVCGVHCAKCCVGCT